MRGYVLAGGRSSRMGQDKAELRLGGATMLEIACQHLRSACGEVVVVGQRAAPAGVRGIADEHAGCGPLGGMEAALKDAAETPEAVAMFLPVDLPLLPCGLIDALAAGWSQRMRRGAKVCMAEADGQMQPLLSAVCPDVLPAVRAALEAGTHKVLPVLREAGIRGGWHAMILDDVGREAGWYGWRPGIAESLAREAWFLNVNTPEDRDAAARWVGDGGAGCEMQDAGEGLQERTDAESI